MIMMKNRKIKKGLTLVEVIISIALIGIIGVTFLTMFTMGFSQIAASGNKSKAIYVSQDQAENKLLEGAASTAASITITFPGASPVTVTLTGEQATKGNITLFIPK
jgi:type IV pilus assembly protein PilA